MLELLVQPAALQGWIAQTFVLTLLGAAVLVSFRAGFINLGVSAQLIVGAIVATYVGHYLRSPWLAAPSCLAAVFAFALLPVWLRCSFGTSEVLTTLLLTFATIPLAKLFLRITTSTLEVASPYVYDEASRNVAAKSASYINALHLLAIPGLLLVWILIEHSTLGYRARALRANPQVFSSKDARTILAAMAFAASLLIVIAVMADAYVYKGRYVDGNYDKLGFYAVAVALIALGKPVLLLPAAAFVAAAHAVFLVLSVGYGVPQMGDHLIYGVAILVAAFLLRPKGRGTNES